MNKTTSNYRDPEKVPSFDMMPGVMTRILTGMNDEKMMMVMSTLEPGVTVPSHSHPHEQIGIVYSGKARMKVGDEEKIIAHGDFVYMPPDVLHEAECLGDEPFTMIDIFHPAREDFLEKVNK